MADGAGVVFMSMGDDDTLHLLAPLHQVRNIRDDVIDSQHIVFREHQTGIDYQDLPIVFVHHHIGADFSQPTEGDDL